MNDPSHHFVGFDPGDCPRCINCDVRSGSRHAEPVCPGNGPSPVVDNVPCVHNSIARCEQTIPWCIDCHQYIDTTTGKPSVAARQWMAEPVELGWDRDTESFQYASDID